MKKKGFYSIHKIDNSIKAIWHEGYTDGRYYYYKDNVWRAIHPETGLAIAYAGTRKQCVQLAYADKAQNALTQAEKAGCINRWIEQFNDYVEAARKAAVYGG